MMQAYTEEQKAALIEHIETELNVLRNVTLKHCDECERGDVERDIRVQEIALASLTARPKAFIEEKAPGRDKFILKGFYLHGLNLDDNLYTAPPAPALRLPKAAEQHSDPRNRNEFYHENECQAWDSALAEVTRLNATAPQPVKRPATKCIGWVRDAIHEHDAKWIEAIRDAGYQVEE